MTLLIHLIFVLVVLCVVYWLLNTAVAALPIPAPVKGLVIALVCLILLLWLLHSLGMVGGLALVGVRTPPGAAPGGAF